MSDIVVIGAGQAGCSLVAKLRALGHTGAITLIGEEADPPYQRPPLSKAYLLGEMERERLYLRPERFYADNGITLKLSDTAIAIDRKDKLVVAGGETFHYDKLALTTGSVPRRLPGAIGGELSGVHVVRTLADVDAMAPACVKDARVLIVGGGYIGLEAAAVCAKLGMQVTLIEMAPRILQRVAAPETSDYFRALHRENGVDIREGVGLERLTGDSVVTGAILSDGTELLLDMVIVGIGISPATGVAEVCGLTIDNGIAVNQFGQTSDPDIYAAGDCASFPHKGGRIRLESVQNAIDQAENAAQNMLGNEVAYAPTPWFWSDQFDTKLQIAGLNTGYDRVVVRIKDNARSHWYYKGDTLLAVDGINAPRAYMVGKRLLEMGKSPSPETITDTSIVIKSLLKA